MDWGIVYYETAEGDVPAANLHLHDGFTVFERHLADLSDRLRAPCNTLQAMFKFKESRYRAIVSEWVGMPDPRRVAA